MLFLKLRRMCSAICWLRFLREEHQTDLKATGDMCSAVGAPPGPFGEAPPPGTQSPCVSLTHVCALHHPLTPTPLTPPSVRSAVTPRLRAPLQTPFWNSWRPPRSRTAMQLRWKKREAGGREGEQGSRVWGFALGSCFSLPSFQWRWEKALSCSVLFTSQKSNFPHLYSPADHSWKPF